MKQNPTEKQLSDCTNVLLQLVDTYGEDAVWRKLESLLPQEPRKYICQVTFGSVRDKNRYNKYVQDVILTEDGILIIMDDEETPIEQKMAVAVSSFIECLGPLGPYKNWSVYQTLYSPDEEVFCDE